VKKNCKVQPNKAPIKRASTGKTNVNKTNEEKTGEKMNDGRKFERGTRKVLTRLNKKGRLNRFMKSKEVLEGGRGIRDNFFVQVCGKKV